MLKLNLAILGAALLAASGSVALASPMEAKPSPARLSPANSQHSGTAIPGDPMFEWFRSRGLAVSDDIPIRYHMTSKGNEASELLAAMTSKDRAGAKNISFDAPPPPGSGPPYPNIGSTSAVKYCGMSISGSAGQTGTGDITINWTFQYTTDSNGDGTNDSDGEWVISSFSAENIEWGTAAGPMEC
jgi:hypothetical protein